jgi:hypothetical protein
MASLSTLSKAQTSIVALSNAALVVPQITGLFNTGYNAATTVGYQPQNVATQPGNVAASQPALLFHYEGENRAIIESDITDHFVEDNTAIQDQIALKPEKVNVHGFIGELNDVPPAILTPLQAAATTLTTVGAFTPQQSITAQLAYNQAFQAYQVAALAINSSINAVRSLFTAGGTSVINGGTFTQLARQNKQQSMFQQFYGYWLQRTLFTVQTPWAVFQNMAIEKLTVTQDPETQVMSDFEVSFKLIRMASSTVTNGPIQGGRLSSQAQQATQLGTSTPAFSLGIPGVS